MPDEELAGYMKDCFIPFVEKKLAQLKTAGADLSEVGPVGLVRIAVILSAEDLYLPTHLKKAYHALKDLGM